MRVVIQRAKSAQVTISDEVHGKIKHGVVVLLGIEHDDTTEDAEWLCKKIANLRIFDDMKAARPEVSEPLYQKFINILNSYLDTTCQTGKFGADMQVSLINNGPVTIIIDTKNKE